MAVKIENVAMFRYLNRRDSYNTKYKWCSRAYEYPTVLDFLDYADVQTIHNTACGHEEIHKMFQADLDKHYDVLHTDIEDFNIVTDVMDRQFDAVLCISTIEHLPKHQQTLALDNLLKQVKNGGWLVVTFDLPTVDLKLIEEYCNCYCDMKPVDAVNGANSVYPQPQYADYNFIILIIAKNE